MSKYVIRNCPAILKITKVCDDYRTTRDNPQLCKDCTDCVLKRIYFKAKESLKECKNCGTFIHECDGCEFNKSSVLNDILQLLDIQECE